jgi:hypothetical protein
MDSEAESSFTPSTSFQSTLKQLRSQVSSAVWAHCRKARDDEDPDPKLKYCTHCTTPSIYCTSISTNMRKYLKGQHKIDVEIPISRVQATTLQQLEQLYLRAELLGQTEEIDAQVFLKQLNQDIIDEALVSLIVVRNLPFQMVEWLEFQAFCQALNPKSDSFITIAHSQIGRKIKEAWQTHKDTIQKKLQSALSSIHLSVDLWTSPNRHLLLVVNADFVDCIKEKYVKALLALCLVKGYGGEEQFDILLCNRGSPGNRGSLRKQGLARELSRTQSIVDR